MARGEEERAYIASAAAVAQSLGMSYYNNPSFEPSIVWSFYQFGDVVDMILNKPIRSSAIHAH